MLAQPCIQLDTDTTTLGSEDCLYLNVFVPGSATASSSLPVMVHLHPGGNFFGAPYEDASAFTLFGTVRTTEQEGTGEQLGDGFVPSAQIESSRWSLPLI